MDQTLFGTTTQKFKKHVFICTNERDNGAESCGLAQGVVLVEAFKALVKKHKVSIDIRTQKAGCLDVCNHGPALVVYPDAIFYGKVELGDVEEIFQSHLLENMPVERLVLHFPKRL